MTTGALNPEPSPEPSIEELLARMRDGDREAAAGFLERYGPRIQRRVRNKLSHAMRRVFDSQEIMSTVRRRLDSYVHAGRLQATSPPQLWALITTMVDAAVIDKVRVFKRLERVEGDDTPFARALRDRLGAASSDRAEVELERLLGLVGDDVDRQILLLWLSGNEHAVIGEFVGLTPGAVRVRWHRIRERLRAALGGEDPR